MDTHLNCMCFSYLKQCKIIRNPLKLAAIFVAYDLRMTRNKGYNQEVSSLPSPY